MARNRRRLAAPPERVYAVLCDPSAYASFVVGTRRVRSFDPRWPAPGTRFRHRLGVGITLIRDETESLEDEPPERLRLRARMRPLAVNDVVFALAPDGEGGCHVEVAEMPVAGPAALPGLARVTDGLLRPRNALLLARLERVVERREARRRAEATD